MIIVPKQLVLLHFKTMLHEKVSYEYKSSNVEYIRSLILWYFRKKVTSCVNQMASHVLIMQHLCNKPLEVIALYVAVYA